MTPVDLLEPVGAFNKMRGEGTRRASINSPRISSMGREEKTIPGYRESVRAGDIQPMQASRNQKNGTVKEGLSIKSKIPPIPGSREPESLMARLRLTRDPARSP